MRDVPGPWVNAINKTGGFGPWARGAEHEAEQVHGFPLRHAPSGHKLQYSHQLR